MSAGRRSARGPLRVAVLGAGVSGLATAFEMARANAGLDVRVFDAAPRAGGNVVTVRHAGCAVDAGPDAIVTSRPEGLALCRAAGLESELFAPRAEAASVLVARNGRALPMPDGMVFGVPRRIGSLATAGALTLRGRMRAALDLVLPAEPDRASLSVGELVEKRLGREVKDWLVEPIVGGIYAADVDRLDPAVAVPPLASARRSLIAALASAARPAGGSPFRAPRAGMDALIDALVARVGRERVSLGARAVRVSREGAGYRVEFEGREPWSAQRVVLAVPPRAAAGMVGGMDPALADELGALRAVSTATVLLAFDAARAKLPDASGLLVPRAEGRALIAATNVSAKWQGRVAEGTVLLRAFVGGARAPGLLDAHDDAALAALALADLRAYFALPDPAWYRVVRFAGATHAPELGARERVARVRARAGAWGGLHLAHAAYEGPGIPGCAAQARRVADALLASLAN